MRTGSLWGLLITATLGLTACGPATNVTGETHSPLPEPVCCPLDDGHGEKLDQPFEFPAVNVFCSHGFRVFQTYVAKGTSSNSGTAVSITAQPDVMCPKY